MKLATGRVVDGKVVLDDTLLEDGTSVTVLAPDDDSFEVAADMEAALLEAIDEAERKDVLPGDEALSKLRRA